jgi:hypothetical protein
MPLADDSKTDAGTSGSPLIAALQAAKFRHLAGRAQNIRF